MDTEDNKNKSIKKPNKNNQKIIDSFLKRNAPKKVENKKDKDKGCCAKQGECERIKRNG